MIGKDPVLDRHIREVSQKTLSNPEFTMEKSKNTSHALGSFHAWLKDVVDF